MRRFVHILLCVVFPLFTIAQVVEIQSINRSKMPRSIFVCENGKYDNLEYWTSFIMLDGLN